MAEITLEIDGKEVIAEEGTCILKAAKTVGIDIPTLCYHPALAPFGGCRLCSVEIIVRDRSKIVTSCNYPVEEGLVVKTRSPEIIKIRQMLIELYMARAPKAEIIQELAKEYGVEGTRFKGDDPENLCILCGLCARICEERIGVSAINFVGRGVERDVETPFHKTMDIDLDVCLACGSCATVCPTGAIKLEDMTAKTPVPIPSEFNLGLGYRAPVYIPFPQAVPNKPVIDKERCVHFATDKCGICQSLCEANAIDFEQEDEVIELEVGAIIAATGYQLFDDKVYGEYGQGKYPDVITGLQLERLLSASGPTGGEVRRPSDGHHPKTVVFVSCVGSRDEHKGRSYCSKFCCMYMAKQAIMLKEHDPEVQCYIFYIDVRAGGKDFDEFAQRAQREYGTLYLRGRVSKIYEDDKKLMVCGEDSLMGRPVEIPADLVVLATAAEANVGAAELAQTLKISYDTNNFFIEAHPKLRPVETQTDGIFLAGSCIGPRDIPESVAQGSAAAAKVTALFSKDFLSSDPMVSNIDVMKCSGCLLCQEVCPFSAIESQVLRDGRTVSAVNESVCKGCGLCVAACRFGAANLRGFTQQQLLAEVISLWQ
ncbi:4Fe-4S binding protein [Chloroflexota bacterium]